MHHILTTTVSAKKGDKQTSRWLIAQDRPYPNLEIKYGRAEWTTVGTLFDGVLPENYRAYLLRSDIEVKDIPYSWDRNHLAGFGSNPGSLVYRGNALGELTCEITRSLTWRAPFNITLSRTETEWLSSQLKPQFREFIAANLAPLKQHVIDYLRTRCEQEVSVARKVIEDADKKITSAINNL